MCVGWRVWGVEGRGKRKTHADGKLGEKWGARKKPSSLTLLFSLGEKHGARPPPLTLHIARHGRFFHTS